MGYIFNEYQTPTHIQTLVYCMILPPHIHVFLENINLILAFIINIISQPIEHLNISSAFIVCSNMEMHVQ